MATTTSTSQEQFPSSNLQRSGVAIGSTSGSSGFIDVPASSIHAQCRYHLASLSDADKHLPSAPSHPRVRVIPLVGLSCLLTWQPPRVGCTCENHPSDLYCDPQYYALEYQVQQIEINQLDPKMATKDVYFGPYNRCTVIVDDSKEYLFRVRCTNDGMNFGPYGGIAPVTAKYGIFEYEALEELGDEDNDKVDKQPSKPARRGSITKLAHYQSSQQPLSITPELFQWSPTVLEHTNDYKPNPRLSLECPKAIASNIYDAAKTFSSEGKQIVDDSTSTVATASREHSDPVLPTEVEECLVEIARLQSILNDFSKQEGRQIQFPSETEETLVEINSHVLSLLDEVSKLKASHQQEKEQSSNDHLPQQEEEKQSSKDPQQEEEGGLSSSLSTSPLLPKGISYSEADISQLLRSDSTSSTFTAHSWPTYAAYYEAYHSIQEGMEARREEYLREKELEEAQMQEYREKQLSSNNRKNDG